VSAFSSEQPVRDHSTEESLAVGHLSWRYAAQLAEPGILVESRLIAPGDESALLPEELTTFSKSIERVRRASGAVRLAARALLAQLGHPECAIPKDKSGAPIWPRDVVGSLAHDSRVAVAAVARRSAFPSIGIDVEIGQPLDEELIPMVLTRRERETLGEDPMLARLVFAIKEAVYKTTYPLDRCFLEHPDVEVDLITRIAVTRNDMSVCFRYGLLSDLNPDPHVCVLAWIPPV
jgi:4'-phosphopantetheinyl transferase EntD